MGRADGGGALMAKELDFEPNPYYTDDVGRRRKLSVGAQHQVMRMWMAGESAAVIADAFGISTSLVRTICYHTRKGTARLPEHDQSEHEARRIASAAALKAVK